MPHATVARPGAEAPPVHKPVDRNAPWPVQFWQSAVGKKWLMALSGVALWGFVFVHMIGNLKLYLGEKDYNEYGESLRTLLHPIMPNHVVLWIMRIGLIGAFVIHIVAAASLTQMNRRSRPVGYQSTRDYISANFASRSMRITGVIILAYLIFHLFDLSWTGTGATYVRGDVYDNVVGSLQRPWSAAAYAIANIALGIHLFHGTWSMFQSMGLNNPRYNSIRRAIAFGMSTVVAVANLTFPILVATKVVK